MPAITFVREEGFKLCDELLMELGYSDADRAIIATAWLRLGQQDVQLLAAARAAAAAKKAAKAAKAAKKGSVMMCCMHGCASFKGAHAFAGKGSSAANKRKGDDDARTEDKRVLKHRGSKKPSPDTKPEPPGPPAPSPPAPNPVPASTTVSSSSSQTPQGSDQASSSDSQDTQPCSSSHDPTVEQNDDGSSLQDTTLPQPAANTVLRHLPSASSESLTDGPITPMVPDAATAAASTHAAAAAQSPGTNLVDAAHGSDISTDSGKLSIDGRLLLRISTQSLHADAQRVPTSVSSDSQSGDSTSAAGRLGARNAVVQPTDAATDEGATPATSLTSSVAANDGSQRSLSTPVVEDDAPAPASVDSVTESPPHVDTDVDDEGMPLAYEAPEAPDPACTDSMQEKHNSGKLAAGGAAEAAPAPASTCMRGCVHPIFSGIALCKGLCLAWLLLPPRMLYTLASGTGARASASCSRVVIMAVLCACRQYWREGFPCCGNCGCG